MFKMLGFGFVNDLEAWTIILVAIALSLIVGWVLDMVTERMGFGIFGNAAICLLGICVALVVFRTYIGEISVQRLPIVLAAATLSVLLHIFTMIFLRRALKL
jgi:uncharacterized membrane protein YeaQ/YmgE (transglycosylase-associated protein family)